MIPETCPRGLPKNHDAGDEFFVSCRNDDRTGLVLGPYDMYEEALANVERGRDMAEKDDAWAHFYAFGTLKIAAKNKGKHKGALGR